MKKEGKLDLSGGDTMGIKGLNMVKRKKLEAYQHLFYLLQVCPSRVRLVDQWMSQQRSYVKVKFLSPRSVSPSDQPTLPGQAHLPDAPKQVH